MKTCPACHRLFPDDGGFCPLDGRRLAPVDEVPVPPDPEDRRIGAFVCRGRYHVRRMIAEGGMGRVYQALDRAADRSVALKILHPEVAGDEVAVERFKREFELSAQLPHEHIVEVLAFERTEDRSFALVMEYLEGEELRMILKRERTLSHARLVRMMSQIAIGLGEAHRRKFVHRDLKPDNLFLCGTHDGDVVKILDFGSVRDNSEGAKKLTVMGTTIGSPFYMSPEQAQGLSTLDERADVWSLAAITYEAVTGKVPFRAASGPAILLAILTKEAAPPSGAGAPGEVPPTLDDLMEASLAKNPDARIGSVEEFADRLGAAFGLPGTHRDWAYLPSGELGQLIDSSLPRALEARSASLDLGRLDAAFAGPPSSSAPAFEEDLVLGVPSTPPRWLLPAIAASAVVVGVVLAALLAR